MKGAVLASIVPLRLKGMLAETLSFTKLNTPHSPLRVISGGKVNNNKNNKATCRPRGSTWLAGYYHKRRIFVIIKSKHRLVTRHKHFTTKCHVQIAIVNLQYVTQNTQRNFV